MQLHREKSPLLMPMAVLGKHCNGELATNNLFFVKADGWVVRAARHHLSCRKQIVSQLVSVGSTP
jgi:hypothetical protein